LRFGKTIAVASALAAAGAFVLRGDLEPWLQHTPAGPAISALYRTVAMPGGSVSIPRPPAEARPALTGLIASNPSDAVLYRLRAYEAEMALDFTAAETDWRAYASKSSDSYAAHVELADFYHRRLRPLDELAALTSAAAVPDDTLRPAPAQNGWHAFERMAALATSDRLSETAAGPVFRHWVARYPHEPDARRKLIEHLSAGGQYGAAEIEIAAYGRDFHDEFEPVRMRANVQSERGNPDAALAVYDRAFRPLWPEAMRAAYFKMLGDEGRLRDFAGRARSALAANAEDLDAAARLFHYFRSQNNPAAARRVLLEYRMAREASRRPWTAEELETLAQLFEWLPDINEAARLYYALYSAPPAGGLHTERALNGLASLLLNSAGQPIQFGSGDLSFYKDIATVDPSPGFLNGILSLVLNWTGVRGEYRAQDQKAGPYFHRAAAAQLVDLLDRRFPRSTYRASLHAGLVAAYAEYGDDASVIRAGNDYLTAFPAGSERLGVAMRVSDALARANRTSEEFALYDRLLRDLAAKASGVPIGSNASAPEAGALERGPGFVQPGIPATRIGMPTQSYSLFRAQMGAQSPPPPSMARSGEYVQVLDKYLSRLAELKRPLDALRVYRTEIDRNPNDPGLYQRLADFVEQNGMSRDVEDVYARAIARFADRSWYHKLARWYLRTSEMASLEKISRQAIAIFSGSELERYFAEVVAPHPDAVLYRQLNVYAHERFPGDLVFVHNLLNAYAAEPTRDRAAAERLLRQYWFYDPALRSRLFEMLSAGGRLSAELAEVRAARPAPGISTNPAALQFVMEAEAWQSHFEAAAPAARELAAAYPGRREFAGMASALYRSLAAYDPRDTAVALTMAGYEQRSNPRDSEILARMGDICADRQLFTRARTYWERMPSSRPGDPDAYLDTATVYWDYYRYDDALRWIAAARKKFDRPALFAYQAGAIYEGKRNFGAAVREYVAGAQDGDKSAEQRLIRLMSRPQTSGIADRATQAAMAHNPTPEAVRLRIEVLEAMQRRRDLESLLRARVEAERSSTELSTLQEDARRLGFDSIEERAGERLAALSHDPVDQMRLTLVHARLLESKRNIAGAARVVDALYRNHPVILGVLRGAVDFHVRNHQPTAAMDLLLDASGRARADLAAQFTLEAARIATGAGQFDRARSLLNGLLAADPLRTEYLAAMADTYLRAGDDRAFRDYQLALIERIRQAPLTPAQRTERIAAVRRSLVPVLDRLKDSAGALDQYIGVLNSYPEDEALAKETAAYAVAHGEKDRLIAFYRKTATASPLDYRWPVVLARIETVVEDYPAAIADYERGSKARPDRTDILEAKALLEERLVRYADAANTYGRLYDLSYRDPEWLVRAAELRARLGQNDAAVDALRTAVIGARSETADADFEIAGHLDSWYILPAAVTFAEHGASLDGAELFKDGEHAATYASVLTHARRLEPVLARLGSNPSTDGRVTQVAGAIVAETYTPEEKLRFEQALTEQAARVQRPVRDAVLLPLAAAAGLAELQARWRWDSMNAPGTQQVDAAWVALESQRGEYAGLGRQLEEYAAKHSGQPLESSSLSQSIQAFMSEGDLDAQLRVMRKALARSALSGLFLDRYFSLIQARYPDELLGVVRGNPSAEVRNRAVQSAIAAGRPEFAYAAIRARGAALPPVWSNAFLALAGEYFDDSSPAIDTAFRSALDTRNIGDRLAKPLKTDSVIAGSVWFYYGARYGEYLSEAKNPEAGAWLPAVVESAPGSPEAYLALGDAYAGAGQPAEAIAQFEHAIELDHDRGDADNRIARVLWQQGRRTEAVARWKSALSVFLGIQRRGVRVPEAFWGRLEATFAAIGESHAMDDLRGDIANLLGDYYQINGEYRLQPLIQSAAHASLVSGTGLDWLVNLGRSMNGSESVFYSLMQTRGLSEAQRISLQREDVNARARQVQGSFGYTLTSAETGLTQARWQLASMLLDAGDVKGATAEWSLVSPEMAAGFDPTIEIRLASRNGTLDDILRRYASSPGPVRPAELLLRAAETLARENDDNGSRAVREFVYDREIRAGRLDPANFLGLAEVKLQRGDTAAGLALLHRMALVTDDGIETLLPAAELLDRYGWKAESLEFIRLRVQAEPWDAQARLQLALHLSPTSAERASLLERSIADSLSPYTIRAQAARVAHASAAVAGTELALLGSPKISADAAAKPYQVEARMDAARQSSDREVQLRLWREALAITPGEATIRIGAERAALALQRDNLALALDSNQERPPFGYYPPRRTYRRVRIAMRLGFPQQAAFAEPPASDDERAAMAEALAAAAERLDDLASAQRYLQTAAVLRPAAQRGGLQGKIEALAAEQSRRSQNAARQPAIRDVIEQDRIVRPRILRSAQ
jgi:tetratricopeptide (TPR) repeat protein